ncbi:MAG: asparagine synthase-related protein [Planctomycetota bacterium]|jgi:asparagine synthase (glutamine-hydrolysing)
MSGFAVVYNNQDHLELENMMKKIIHRGPYLYGKFNSLRVLMAQNYLRGDVHPVNDDVFQMDLPVHDARNFNLRICYDGQIGNWETLAHSQGDGLSGGPYREERLLLYLYRQYGPEMLQYLGDAIFAFVISDGEGVFAARDLLGIKTLFYGKKNTAIYFASELKSILAVTDEVYEFPAGHYLTSDGQLTPHAKLPENPPDVLHDDLAETTETIRAIISRSITHRVQFNVPTGCLLSGGIDSSVVAWQANDNYKKKFGNNARLMTFALGVGESEDIQNARLMVDHINSEHHELFVDLNQILETLPDVIYYLESFDPSLVRSAVANYLISRYAKEMGIEVLLSGEGGDEIFCGYQYLKRFPADELFERQMECLGFLHNNASLRLDRMNLGNSIRVVAPLISGQLLKYTLSIPTEFKLKQDGGEAIEKWIFRKAFEEMLPQKIVWRLKQEFSQGSGTADIFQ